MRWDWEMLVIALGLVALVLATAYCVRHERNPSQPRSVQPFGEK
jgi:hypothetical protein